MKKLLLVDGHYYLYRSFFAIRGLTNSKGEPTNALFGFTKSLRLMRAHVQPDFGIVVWDSGLPERRTALQPEYKQQREEMPADLRAQEDPMREIVCALGFGSTSAANTEADDLIASYARHFDGEVVIATNDKDILQIVDDRVKIYSTNKTDRAAPTDGFALLGIAEVQKKWGVEPARIADVLALTGDSSDNIPGVDGVGNKTAAALVNQFGSVDNLLANLDQVTSQRVREKLAGARAQILENREMVGLDCDLALPMAAEDAKFVVNYPALIDWMRRCEFRSLLVEVEREAGGLRQVEQSELF